ncbi:phosphoserine phosphatase SerB [Streptomyces sp. NPDC002550]
MSDLIAGPLSPNGAPPGSTLLVSVFGRDQADMAASLFSSLAAFGTTVMDLEKVRTREHVALSARVLTVRTDAEGLLRTAVRDWAAARELYAEVSSGHGSPPSLRTSRCRATVVAQRLSASTTAAICRRITDAGGRLDRITPLTGAATAHVSAVEFVVSGTDTGTLRAALSPFAGQEGTGLSVERMEHTTAGPRSPHDRRLVVLDVDSTLIQDEVVDLFARHAGCGPQVAEVTEAAMRGELDFAQSLRARVALLAGLDASVVDQVRSEVRLTPGARTLVRSLRRLGHRVGVVSGGFTQVTDHLAELLDLDFAAANTLEVADGRFTGRLVGDIVDRAGKARLLRRYAHEARIPLSRTVAIGDGANDLDMLATAGLGVAFNAKPTVRSAAPATLNVPYLDAVLPLLGIPRR